MVVFVIGSLVHSIRMRIELRSHWSIFPRREFDFPKKGESIFSCSQTLSRIGTDVDLDLRCRVFKVA